MTVPSPLISIILPAYNVASFVGQTVASLAAQDWPALELVAVDDGSTDETATVLLQALERFRASGDGRHAILVTRKNGGLGAARNTGLEHATGDLILFADGDDLFDPGAVSALVGALHSPPAPCLVFPRCRYIDETGMPIGLESGGRESRFTAVDLLFENPIHTDTGVLLRRDMLRDAGSFDTTLPSAIGLDMWVRSTAGQGACIAQVPQVLVSYRRRRRQITSNWRRQRAGWETVRMRACEEGLLDRRMLRRAKARAMMVWATGAYASGEFRAFRGLMAGAMSRDPIAVLSADHGRLKLAAAVATLLPQCLHRRLVDLHARLVASRHPGRARARR